MTVSILLALLRVVLALALRMTLPVFRLQPPFVVVVLERPKPALPPQRPRMTDSVAPECCARSAVMSAVLVSMGLGSGRMRSPVPAPVPKCETTKIHVDPRRYVY